MPKISPRPSVTAHPLYQATLKAQHAAYQVMRGVPPEWKAAAARLHVSCVHATTYAQYALDPDVADRPGNLELLLGAVAEAREQLEPLLAVADSNEGPALSDALAAVEAEVAKERSGGEPQTGSVAA